jgi:hypothetical protein
MRRVMELSVIFVLTVAGASTGYTAVTGQQSVLYLAQNSDLIVVGTASGGSRGGTSLIFSLQIVRVVKGNASLAGTMVSVNWNVSPAQPLINAGRQFQAEGTGVWFLKASSGGWALLPVMTGAGSLESMFVPSPPGPLPTAYAYSPVAPLNDRVASELSAAIENGNGAPQLLGLHYGLLEQLNSVVIQTLYSRLSESPSIPQIILGISGLIRAGNISALFTAYQQLAGESKRPEYGVLLWSIREAFRRVDPSSVAALGQIATASGNPNLQFRQAAAHALAAIHTREALPYLAMLLDDADQTLRAEGVGGLAAFANGLPVQTSANLQNLGYLQFPAQAPYQTPETKAHFSLGVQTISKDEASYLAFWKSWWAANRASLGF